jgi:hypothetical protein
MADIPPQPEFRHTDVDGDRLLITTADIPGQGPGIHFRTDPDGSSVPLGRLDELISQLQTIAESARVQVGAE